MNIYEKLTAVQVELKAPKDKDNKFGGYKYRSCESILEAVKPLLAKRGLALTIQDDIVLIQDRFYVKATATVYDYNATSETFKTISVQAFAREEESKKGMDGSQVTGAASSYARKYALNGLFAIDDTKDADTNEYAKMTQSAPKKTTAAQQTVAAGNCVICQKPIVDHPTNKKYTAKYVIAESTKKYGAAICLECLMKKAAQEKEKAQEGTTNA